MLTIAKFYRSHERLQRSLRNHETLRLLGAPVPALVAVDRCALSVTYERLVGHPPACHDDLCAVAAALGRLHLPTAVRVACERHVEPFWAARAPLLARAIDAVPHTPLRTADLPVVAELAGRAVDGLYKDTNCRNVVLREGAVFFLDFDDLTLAPAGYDLAKLVVSTSMSSGRRPDVEALRDVYIADLGIVPEKRFGDAVALWCVLHDLLTARYLGSNGYRHRWVDVALPRDDAAVRRALGR